MGAPVSHRRRQSWRIGPVLGGPGVAACTCAQDVYWNGWHGRVGRRPAPSAPGRRPWPHRPRPALLRNAWGGAECGQASPGRTGLMRGAIRPAPRVTHKRPRLALSQNNNTKMQNLVRVRVRVGGPAPGTPDAPAANGLWPPGCAVSRRRRVRPRGRECASHLFRRRLARQRPACPLACGVYHASYRPRISYGGTGIRVSHGILSVGPAGPTGPTGPC